jgi:hypothetical protein
VGEPAVARPSATRSLARRLVQPALLLLRREPFPVLFLAATVVALIYRLPTELAQDSWLSLVAGRAVAHGLPHHDFLTALTYGRTWIDQQWLAQLCLYGLFVAGGIKLAMLIHVALIVLAVAAGIAVARWRGASSIRVAMVAGACVPITSVSWQLRTQTLACPLFVLLLWLLVADSLAPSRRVFLALPILALWANLHGSVVLAALLVALRGATVAAGALRQQARARRQLARGLTLMLAPALCVFASPYGFALAGYYRHVLLNPGFAKYIVEWQVTKPEAGTIPFFGVVLAGFWLLGRSRSLTTFERLAFALAAVLGLESVRNILWLGLTAIVVLPRALDEAWPPRTLQRERLNLALSVAATGAAVVAVIVAIARPFSWLERRWPQNAAAAVAKEMSADPSLRVYADLEYADWLLFDQPALRGRVATDARVELLTLDQLRELSDFTNRVGDWRRAVSGYRLLVLSRAEHPAAANAYLADAGVRPLYRDGRIVVLLRRR